MHDKRTVEHYRDHELVYVVSYESKGWTFTMHVVGHEGDFDKVRREECSPRFYSTDIDAIAAARQRGHAVIDAIVDG